MYTRQVRLCASPAGMRERSALLEEKEKIKRMKTVQNKAYMAILAMRIVPHICKTLYSIKKK